MMLTNQQIDDLLKPIYNDKPCGEDIAFEYIVDQIKEARITDDPDDPLPEWETERRVADWKAVTELSIKALTDLSKDLQIAFWLVESQYKQFAWEGLNVGLKLLIKLSTEFGNDIYPHSSEGKQNLIVWFLNKLYLDLRKIPLYKHSSSTFANFKRLNTEDYAEAIAEAKGLLQDLKTAFEGKFEDEFPLADDVIGAVASIEKILVPPPEARVEVVNNVDKAISIDDDIEINKDIDIDALPIIDDVPGGTRIREQLPVESYPPAQPLAYPPAQPLAYPQEMNGYDSPEDISNKIADVIKFFAYNKDEDPIEIFLRAAEKLRYHG